MELPLPPARVTRTRLHFDRTSRGDRHHRHSRGAAAARVGGGERAGAPSQLQEQHAPIRSSRPTCMAGTTGTGFSPGVPNATLPPDDDHLPVISNAVSNAIIQYVVSQRLMECPILASSFPQKAGRPPVRREAVRLCHRLQLPRWPRSRRPGRPSAAATPGLRPKLTDGSSLVLVSDMNDWSPGYGQSYRPARKERAKVADGSRWGYFC